MPIKVATLAPPPLTTLKVGVASSKRSGQYLSPSLVIDKPAMKAAQASSLYFAASSLATEYSAFSQPLVM